MSSVAYSGDPEAERSSSMRTMAIVCGIACTVFGVVMLFNLRASIGTIVVLTGLGFVLGGVSQLVTTKDRSIANWIAAGLLICAGLVALAWPAMTIRGLVLVVGVGMALSGAVQVVSAIVAPGRSDRSALNVVEGLVSVVLGALAIVWPEATVAVLAFIFGIRVVLTGLATVVTGFQMHSPREDDGALFDELQ
jgi:uncharacterized membrane protein HdeD (DUF308 family)